MGVVYRAHDQRLRRDVAIKVLRAATLRDESARSRFRQEAQALARLNHPNIGMVFDFNTEQGLDFLVMELVEGETLFAKLQAGPLPGDQVWRIGSQIAAALGEAHDHGIVHRDLKPANVLITSKGQAKVLDFGLARLLEPAADPELTVSRIEQDAVAGTVPYMAPEQLRGQLADLRSDVWALGVVLFEMAVGKRPFAGQTGFELSSAILNRPLPALPAQVPVTLRAVIGRCLEKEPDRRYQRGGEAYAALEATKPVAAAAPSSTPVNSVAVLYFENMSSEKESDYLCAGITDDIITDLSRIGSLKVVSRMDVLPFRNKEVNLHQVGETLRVNYVMQGSVRKAGNKIRVTAQLIGVQDGYHLWAERFDGQVEDIFEFQNEVSQKIAKALKVSLSDSEKQSLAKKPTDDLRAYDFYLRGKDFLYQRGRKNNENAIHMFESAVAIDAAFAASYAGLAEAYSAMFEWYDGHPSWLAKAIETNEKALELDAACVDARFGIAMVYFYQKRLRESKRALEEILRENPEYYPAHLRLGMIEEFGGNLDSALQSFLRAAELKPYDEDPWRCLVGVYGKLNNDSAAHDAALKVIEVTSRKLEASLDDVVVMSRLAEAYARYGGRAETHATLRRVLELDPSDGLALYNCACAFALLGEKKEALLLLRRAFESGFRAVGDWAKADRAFDQLRGEVEFRQLVAELG